METTGRTVEEAKDAALDQLGVDEQDAEFEILEEPRTGLFGRLRSEARVRARVRPTRPRPKEDRRDRRKRERQRDGRQASGGGGGARNGSGGNGGGGGSPRPEKVEQKERAQAPRPAAQAEKEEAVSDGVSLAEQGEVARQFVIGLVERFGAQASVALHEVDEETIEVTVDGDNLGLLIGPKGATLTALQEVTRTVVQRQTAGRHGRIMVDVAGYRQKRREALERFTRQLADQVKASGERKVLEPMHPADRKVVHDTVNTIDGVRTTSEGEEPRRRVVILPE